MQFAQIWLSCTFYKYGNGIHNPYKAIIMLLEIINNTILKQVHVLHSCVLSKPAIQVPATHPLQLNELKNKLKNEITDIKLNQIKLNLSPIKSWIKSNQISVQ